MKDQNNDDYFEKQSPSTLRSIGGLLTFSTILPLNVYTTIDEMAKLTWFWPVLNGLIGLIATIIAFILTRFLHFEPLLVATIIYGFLLIINGYNHFDGLMDFGDGVMVHGPPEKKLSIMKDPMTGVGGIATGFIVGTITIAAFNSGRNLCKNRLNNLLHKLPSIRRWNRQIFHQVHELEELCYWINYLLYNFCSIKFRPWNPHRTFRHHWRSIRWSINSIAC